MIAQLRRRFVAPLIPMLGTLVLGVTMQAQGPAPGSIHGHVNNVAGQPVSGVVKLTTEKGGEPANIKWQYTFDVDKNGDYKGTGVAPGDYLVDFFADNKSVDFLPSVKIAAGEDKAVNLDMTRAEYIAKMTPEEKKQLEEYKAKNASVNTANQKINNLNAMLLKARADTKAGDYAPAIAAMQQATAALPNEAILWMALGDAQLGDATASAKGGKGSDPAVQQKFGDAATSYQKAVDANAAGKKPMPETAGAAYNQLGQSLSGEGKLPEAQTAYDDAAKAQPAMAATYYYNEAAVFYNSGKMDQAAAAADKTIAVDPKKADAYYIKAQALIQKASVDPKTQKVVVPPGCVDAYQKYLELEPNGPHAADITGILQGIGEQVKSSYRAPGKKGK
jgi:tetratricopeptide (TPR) repeat protein